MTWKFVKPSSGNKFAALGILKNVPERFQLMTGTPRAAGFPPEARLEMDPNYPKQLALADSYSCYDPLWVASKRLAELVAAHTPLDLELLPVTIVDHKGRPVEVEHFVIHALRVVDAIDMTRSVVTWNSIDSSAIDTVKPLVLDEAKLPTDVGVVRLLHLNGATLVSQPLQAAIAAAGMTGLRWTEVGKYTG